MENCGCGLCNHDESKYKHEAMVNFGGYKLPAKRLWTFAAALVLWAAGLLLISQTEEGSRYRLFALVPIAASYLIAGLPVLKNAAKSLSRGFSLDENFLMSIATIGAFAIGEWEEAAGVMLFFMIGSLIEEAAVEKSRSSINALLALKPDTARVLTAQGWTEVSADEVAIGSKVLVRAGERIPLDGFVVEGSGSVDKSMLTGESMPVSFCAGDAVQSGTLSIDGVLTIETTKIAGESSAAKIIDMVQNAREAKAKPERFITSFARWYTPCVVGAAVLIAAVPPIVLGANFSVWLYRALTLLVISCPCALVVSIPLGYFAGIGGMSSSGIMVKNGRSLDALVKPKFVIFDKTGTLTTGAFSLRKTECAQAVTEQELLAVAAAAEAESNHPIARAIVKAAAERGIMVTDAVDSAQIKEIAGCGIEYTAGAAVTLAGNKRLMDMYGVKLPPDVDSFHPAEAASAVYIAQNGVYYGRILTGDTLKDGAAQAVARLETLGVSETALFSGDTRSVVEETAASLGIKRVAPELLPEDKLAQTEKLTRLGTTVFVGDGLNDAPVLARSDVGIAMGSGADAAVESADVIIMTDDVRRVPEAIECARLTRAVVMSNVVFALAAKLLFITLSVLGITSMWLAIIADVGVCLIAVLNSTRCGKGKKQIVNRRRFIPTQFPIEPAPVLVKAVG